MAGIQQPRQADRFGPPNKILAVVPVGMSCVVFTNGEGRESMALVLNFAKDAEDGGPGVYVMADQQQMVDQLKIASKLVRDGVRAHLARQGEAKNENVPTLEIPGLTAENLTSGEGFDITQVNLKT